MIYDEYVLSDMCYFAEEKVPIANLDLDTYISTENILPDKGGIVQSSGLPNLVQTQAYRMRDVLISNIRPYFKKIWFADRNGGCSNDVLVLRAKEECKPHFLYYLLSDDRFFMYATATAKGTKMPRGDKSAIMRYKVPKPPLEKQELIASTLGVLDARIAVNRTINNHLEKIAQAIWMERFDGLKPNCKLADLFPVRTGKKDANVAKGGIYPFFSCSQKTLYTDQYSFDGKAILLAGNGDFNVKVYSGKFEAYQRTYVLMPNDASHLGYLYYTIKQSLDAITSGFRGSVIRFITKGSIENFDVFVPNDAIMLDFFNLVVSKIMRNNEENTMLIALRDSLLPRLLTGEVLVVDIDGK